MQLTIRAYVIEVRNKEHALSVLASVGADQAGCRWMAPKAIHRLVMLEGLLPKQANIIKQEMLGKGGEAAVSRGVIDGSVRESKVLLMGTLKQYGAFLDKLMLQPFGLADLAVRIRSLLNGLEERPSFNLVCRDKIIRLGERTLVVGILNVTPDSFSDGGIYRDCGSALIRAKQMVADGADIIDLGGESTRPGYKPVDVGDELSRVIPVLRKLIKEVSVPISVDTTKIDVARQALEAGAHIINNQRPLDVEPAMYDLVAEYGAPLVLMHNQQSTEYRDLIGDLIEYFLDSIKVAMSAGVARDKLIIDPGFGFGKSTGQNLEVLRRLRELRCLGLPILIGTSRKSTIGKVLGLPVDQRVEGTAATVAVGIANGADIVRVHDVKKMVRVARMTDAIVRGK
ncbi:MAG: dihydropteroate synthase [Desulfotomaculaceae bacterium]|nr:dihydropteroate synthase [Desulfotomaculaceae bacterium]